MSKGWESATQEDLSQKKTEGGNKMAEQVKKT